MHVWSETDQDDRQKQPPSVWSSPLSTETSSSGFVSGCAAARPAAQATARSTRLGELVVGERAAAAAAGAMPCLFWLRGKRGSMSPAANAGPARSARHVYRLLAPRPGRAGPQLEKSCQPAAQRR